jgi:two-component system, LytTR family, response regulator
MKIIIIEDEKPAAEKLLRAIEKTGVEVEVLAILNSVQASVAWLKQHPEPELIFMDIELGDGNSFQILERVNINCPVIFCTAYDEYWQEAFEYNSIDYLLKPVKQEKMYFASNFQQLQEWRQLPQAGAYKKRFLVKRGIDLVSIKTDDIAYFYATHKLVCMVDNKSQKYILDQSLADIEKLLDPAQFYRVNRKYLVQQNAIRRMKAHAKSKLLLELEPATAEEVVISQENLTAFKEWMGN